MKTVSKSFAMLFVIFTGALPAMTTGQAQVTPKTVTGTVVSIDQRQGDILVKTDSGDTIKICDVYHYFGQVSQYLEVSVSGADFAARLKNFSDFKVGDRVEISYRPGHTELDSFKKIPQQSKATPRMGVPTALGAKQVRVAASVKDESAVPPRFIDNRDGTVTDTKTKLMWQKGDSGAMVTFQEAQAYCKGLKLAGHTDWRLPKKDEKDEAVVVQLMMPKHSKEMPADFYWSDDPTLKLAFNFLASHVSVSNIYGAKEGSRAYVRAVRGSPQGLPGKTRGER
jgi:hypothetical protein